METKFITDVNASIVRKKGVSKKTEKEYEFYVLIIKTDVCEVEIPIDDRTAYGAKLGVIARMLT